MGEPEPWQTPTAPPALYQEESPMKAVLYGRVSSADQEERNTIAMQPDYASRWAPANHFEVVRHYLDEDVSGTIMFPDRPAGRQLLQDTPALRKQGVSHVL